MRTINVRIYSTILYPEAATDGSPGEYKTSSVDDKNSLLILPEKVII